MRILTSFIFIGIIYVLQRILYERYWDRNLKVSLSFETASVSEGEKTYLVECVENNKVLPIPLLRVKFSASRYFLFGKEQNSVVTDQYYRHNVYSMASYQRITRKYPFTCTKRGCYSIHHIDLISRDLFLSGILANQLTCDSMLYVFPGTVPMEQLPENVLTSLVAVLHQAALNEDPFELKGIRNYMPYDSMHHINWKQSARTGQLMVNTHFPTASQNVSIYLNLDPNIVSHQLELQEESIRIAYTIATMLQQASIPFRFISNGIDMFTGEALAIEAGSGSHAIEQLGTSLARIDLNKKTENFTPTLQQFFSNGQLSHQLILISNYRKPDLLDTYERLLESGYTCLFLLPILKSVEVMDTLIPHSIQWEVDYLESSLSEAP